MEDRYYISVDIGEDNSWSVNTLCGFGEDTHDKVYELNKQMCDLDISLRNPIKPLSEETAQELIGKWEKIGKEWASKKKEIVESIFGNITNEKSNIMEEKKTKKMTKAEAFEWLKCKKVSVSCIDTSEKVQMKMFDCGMKWRCGESTYYDFGSFLLIDNEGFLSHCGNDEKYWKRHAFEEISADDILSIEIVDEKQCKEEDAFDLISTVGARLSEVLRRMEGNKHVVITETDVLLYDEGISLYHSDPF